MDSTNKSDRLLTEIERQHKYLAALPSDFSFPLFNTKNALESQRSSAYRDTAAAAREIVDNAIEAAGDRVHVVFETYQKEGKGRRLVKSIAFIDNGAGMSNFVDETKGEVRHMARFALTWGGGTHSDDPQFIGRFGFGLPNASINQGRRTEVYSRTGTSIPFTKAVLDIDKFANSYGMQSIPPIEMVDRLPVFIEDYLKRVGWLFETGTVIVWTNLDRLTYKTPSKLKEHLLDDFGVTYRYLLEKDPEEPLFGQVSSTMAFELVVDGKHVLPVDPLFLEPGCQFVTGYDDLRAEEIEDITLKVALIDDVKTDETRLVKVENPYQIEVYREHKILRTKGAMRIRVARLPVGFAQGESKHKGTIQYRRFMIRKPRRGMSFVRANREIQTIDVFPKSESDVASGLGNWPMLQTYAYHWGIEVRFTPELDEVFGITNDKQGVRPIQDFWRILANEGFDELLRRENNWQQKQRKKQNNSPASLPKGNDEASTPAEEAAENADPSLDGSEFTPPNSRMDEARANLEKAALELAQQQNIPLEEARQQLQAITTKKKYTIQYFENEYAPAWEPRWIGLQVAVYLNTAHPFYSEIYSKLLSENTKAAYQVKSAIDIVLIALSRAELKSQGDMMEWYKVQREQRWSQYIKIALNSLKSQYQEEEIEIQDFENVVTYAQTTAVALDNALREMGFKLANYIDPSIADEGPSVIRHKISLQTNSKLSALQARSQDIMRELSLLQEPMIDNLPGTNFVYIDIPHPNRHPVLLSNYLSPIENTEEGVNFPVGITPSGDMHALDITKLPHMLVAGSTGSGKTTFLYTLISYLTHNYTPEELELLLIDPKQTDFVFFNHLTHLRQPIITDPTQAIQALHQLLDVELQRRTDILTTARARDIKSYNRRNPNDSLPCIVVVIDEFADLADVMTGQDRERFEQALRRLAQRARSVGIHLVVATQRPTADIVNGTIKTNLPCRISFRLASSIDSRTILDQSGAEKLLGQGDMLIAYNGDTTRLQGFYVSEEELEEMFG